MRDGATWPVASGVASRRASGGGLLNGLGGKKEEKGACGGSHPREGGASGRATWRGMYVWMDFWEGFWWEPLGAPQKIIPYLQYIEVPQ